MVKCTGPTQTAREPGPVIAAASSQGPRIAVSLYTLQNNHLALAAHKHLINFYF